MNKREAERKIREILEQVESGNDLYVAGVKLVKVDAGGLLGPNFDYGMDVEIKLKRKPSYLWMKD